MFRYKIYQEDEEAPYIVYDTHFGEIIGIHQDVDDAVTEANFLNDHEDNWYK